MDSMEIFNYLSHIILVNALGFYLITNLQWYNYKIERVIFKHKRISWHILFFIVPVGVYYFTGLYFWIYFYFGYISTLILWHRKLDKKLIFTDRVKRFFAILTIATLFQNSLCQLSSSCQMYGLMLPLILSLLASDLIEKLVMRRYKSLAKAKLNSMESLKIIALTASYGKTSMKHFIAEVLSTQYRVSFAKGSVNTLNGIVKDINQNLKFDTEIYIVEAGAREQGDIDEIVEFTQPHYVVLGKVGEQHIEYFKSLDNILKTKLEILNSNRLKRAFIFRDIDIIRNDIDIVKFPNLKGRVNSSLDGIEFNLNLDGRVFNFKSNILGEFNYINISSAIYLGRELGISIEKISKAIESLTPIKHRLQKLNNLDKFIIDDSFNGNFEGMREAIKLCSAYQGRKVIVTCGLMESSKELNLELAKEIDRVFDIAIITSKLNRNLLSRNLHHSQKIILEHKEKLTETLAIITKKGDLILFANDAPNYL